jgi:hypothetical protein
VIKKWARAALVANRRATDLRWRQPPRFTVHSGQSSAPAVYYLAPHPTTPRGGVRNIYRHVDQLAAIGIPAAVVHAKRGFRATWFANETRVLHSAEVTLGPRDVLVVPECYGPGLHRLPAGVRVVIFNQGVYHTFDRIAFESTDPGAPYATLGDLVAILTVSHDSAELLRYAFPKLPVQLARNVVDGAVFHPGPNRPGRRIAYLTHRRTPEREQLLHVLRARGVLDGWELVPIAGRTEQETAAMMRGSAVFLSFSEREGFGLPPAEAMASGCHVVGYTGMGGRDFFDPAYCTPVPDSDLLGFARAVEEARAAYDADPTAFAKSGQAASEHILSTYSAQRLREELSAFYSGLGFAPGR